ncbi:MAG: hypothetical protein ACE5EC_05855 [Phycisphaerae bacterium]
MIPPRLVRITRLTGWLILLASCGAVVGTILWQTPGALHDSLSLWPTPRLWRYFVTTLWMSGGATLLSLTLAIPAAYALVRAPRAWQRRILLSLILMPLLTMPSIFAYAWSLLATSDNPYINNLMRGLGWQTPGLEPLQTAWVLATWLWPIPALILATSFKYFGAGSYRLACLETSPLRAFLRAALPVMRAPLIAAAAIVFILAALDAAIGPLLLASEIWSVEMIAAAGVAGARPHPAATLALQAWPILAAIALLVIAALPGLRQMTAWSDESDDTGTNPTANARTWILAVLLAAVVTLFPVFIFATELGDNRYTPGQSFQMALDLFRTAGMSSLIVALGSALAAMVLTLAALDDPSWPLVRRLPGLFIMTLVLITAVLPPPIIGATLAAFFTNEFISPSDGWNLYDYTPIAWIASMLARFAFIPVCIVRLLNRRIPEQITAQAQTDGADRIQCLAAARLPFLWHGLLAGGLAVACMALSEIAASGLVQPPQWGYGSIAVHLDSEMHYGRRASTVALSLLMMLPALLAAVALPLMTRWPTLRRGGMAKCDSPARRSR